MDVDYSEMIELLSMLNLGILPSNEALGFMAHGFIPNAIGISCHLLQEDVCPLVAGRPGYINKRQTETCGYYEAQCDDRTAHEFWRMLHEATGLDTSDRRHALPLLTPFLSRVYTKDEGALWT